MLHNSGSYVPGDNPINMGPPNVGPQMSAPLDIGHNLNNLGKIAQQTPQLSSGQYNLPDYSTYGHPPLNIGSQLNSFSNYQPMSFPTGYTTQTSFSDQDTSWSNNMLPMNLNTQVGYGNNITDYQSDFDKKPDVNIRKMPLNIPQIPMKSFTKDSTDDDYSMFNYNQDRFNNFHQNIDVSGPEKSIMSNSKRKSLENTVRLIEDILISTTKNKELQQNQNNNKQETKTSESIKEIHNQQQTLKTVKDTLQTETLNLTKSSVIIKTKESRTEKTIDYQNKSINNENKGDPLMITEEKPSETIDSVKLPINIVIKPEVDSECEAEIDIKVEPMSWTETDYAVPFHRDSNGVSREDASDCAIVDYENSINEAMAVAKNGLKTNCYYECPHCNLLINHPKRFLIHTKWHTFGLTYERRTELAREREFQRNQRKEAKIIERINSKEITDASADTKTYPCKECDKVFGSKGSLKNHKQRFHPRRVRECKICGETVLGWFALRSHLAAHSSAGYKCTECPKQFKYPHSLAKHRETHLEKTVSCPECPKKFGTASQLKMHQKVHERAQRGTTFRCSYCAKGFYESYNLAVHERTHRNERPFLCEICNTSFGTNSSLKRHMKVSHNSAKPYECSTCHRSFMSASIRDRHAARAHGDPTQFPYPCTECDSKYLRMKDLQKHVYKTHPKGKKKKKTSDSE